ncbi:MAG TPA: hypothetical protein VJO16_02525 [Candidatus Acidoferrum sp.]|nr:hypothetical protein [Candidatus Acidoferrum sp.]
MDSLVKYPVAVLALSFFAMWLSARIGLSFGKSKTNLEEYDRQDLDVIVAGSLTLLGLIIGFSFSMAITRYDQRKTYEEAEANAIGTEYVRADLLPASQAEKVRALLKPYLDQRILFYQTRDERELQKINARTAQLQSELWSTVTRPTAAEQTAVLALAVSGMSDVLNSQGYTQAIWWNRIPAGAWLLMAAVAICSNLLVGYSTRRPRAGIIRIMVLPFVLCIAFFAIADIDSPRRGLIRVHPQNLISLVQSLH